MLRSIVRPFRARGMPRLARMPGDGGHFTGTKMLYQAYQAYVDATDPIRAVARGAIAAFGAAPWAPSTGAAPPLNAMCELVALAGLTAERPEFAIETVQSDGREVAVIEEPVLRTPFCTLLHFRKDIARRQPIVLIVAPLSGHFATLLRGTVRTMLRDHDVYITDWHNVRDVPLDAGRFGLDEYVAHLTSFIARLGPDVHLLSVCQPTVPTLAAVALPAQDRSALQPRSMTLMAGPIDPRVNPTEVNRLATRHSLKWFERHLIGVVPSRYAGSLRRVYPGFLQIGAFMSLNLDRHSKSLRDMYQALVDGQRDKAAAIKRFYEEYFAAMDLPADYYLETVGRVFQEALLPQGRLEIAGRRVDPGAIRDTALLTVEGERDDICGAGQTRAAIDLCTGLRADAKRHHLQPGVGHYGVFSGRRWEQEIYPIVREFIAGAEPRATRRPRGASLAERSSSAAAGGASGTREIVLARPLATVRRASRSMQVLRTPATGDRAAGSTARSPAAATPVKAAAEQLAREKPVRAKTDRPSARSGPSRSSPPARQVRGARRSAGSAGRPR